MGAIKQPVTEMDELDKNTPPNNEEQVLYHKPVAGYLRLHHFAKFIAGDEPYKDSSLYLAIEGQSEEIELVMAAYREAKRWVTDRDKSYHQLSRGESNDFAYIYDVIGNWRLPQTLAWRQRTIKEMVRLATLPDSAVIKLGVTRDIICEGCAVGEHCSLRTMARYNPSHEGDKLGLDTIAGEQQARDTIIEQLTVAEYQHTPGIDYAIGEELVELVEDDGTKAPVSAPYMLVTMGAVRNLIFSTSKAAVE